MGVLRDRVTDQAEHTIDRVKTAEALRSHYNACAIAERNWEAFNVSLLGTVTLHWYRWTIRNASRRVKEELEKEYQIALYEVRESEAERAAEAAEIINDKYERQLKRRVVSQLCTSAWHRTTIAASSLRKLAEIEAVHLQKVKGVRMKTDQIIDSILVYMVNPLHANILLWMTTEVWHRLTTATSLEKTRQQTMQHQKKVEKTVKAFILDFRDKHLTERNTRNSCRWCYSAWLKCTMAERTARTTQEIGRRSQRAVAQLQNHEGNLRTSLLFKVASHRYLAINADILRACAHAWHRRVVANLTAGAMHRHEERVGARLSRGDAVRRFAAQHLITKKGRDFQRHYFQSWHRQAMDTAMHLINVHGTSGMSLIAPWRADSSTYALYGEDGLTRAAPGSP